MCLRFLLAHLRIKVFGLSCRSSRLICVRAVAQIIFDRSWRCCPSALIASKGWMTKSQGQCREGHPFRGFHRRPHPPLSNVHQAQTWQWRQPQPRSPKAVEKPMLSRDRSSSLVRGGSAMRSETPEVSRPHTITLKQPQPAVKCQGSQHDVFEACARNCAALSCQRLGGSRRSLRMSVQRKRSLPLFSQGQTPETTPEPQTLSWTHGRVQSKFLTEQQQQQRWRQRPPRELSTQARAKRHRHTSGKSFVTERVKVGSWDGSGRGFTLPSTVVAVVYHMPP